MRIQGTGTGQTGLSAMFGSGAASTRRSAAGLSSLIPSAKESLTSTELEKHLLDVRKGLGGLSRQTALALSDFEDQTSRSLAPKNLANYLGYLGAFSYDKRARFVNGVKEAVSLNDSLQRARENPVELPSTASVDLLA